MNVITSANEESALLTSLDRTLVSDFYTYRLTQNAPNKSKSVVAVSPQISHSGTTHGQDFTFRVPRYGLWKNACIKATIVHGIIAAPQETRIGERLFSRIELRSHNNVICSQTPESCAARIDELNQEANNAYTSITSPDVSFAGAGTTVVYIPLFLPFFEKSSNYLDLRFAQQLDLVCTVNSAAGMGLAADFTSATYELEMFYINLANDVLQSYQLKNFPGDEAFNMLSYDQYTENYVDVTPAGTAGTVTIDLKCNNAVHRTHFIIKSQLAGATLNEFTTIDTFSITATGQTLVNMDSRLSLFDMSMYDVSGTTSPAGSGSITYNPGSRPLTYNWGESKDRTWNSGSVAFSNLNSPQATMTFTADGTGTTVYRCYVVHEYWNYLTIEPSDGVVVRGIST